MTPALDRFVFEVNFGTFFGAPIWYDLSAYLDLEAGPLSVTRGRQRERATPSPGQLTAQLINDDGRFTPDRAASPYWPYVLDGAPTRLRYLAAGTNLEDNASHEAAIAEWAGGGTGTAPTLAPDTTHVYPDSGQWAMLITWANNAVDSLAQRTIYGLTVGQTYTWSRYVWVPTGSPNVRLQVGGNGLFATGSYVSTKDAFARATVTFVATYTSHVIQLQVASSVGGGQCWTDAGQGEEGSSATTLSPPAVLLPIYYGHALEWPFGWDGAAAIAASTQFVAVDLLRRLPRRPELRPMVIEEALLDDPLLLLPLDEPDGATQVGNLGSVQSFGTLLQEGSTGTYEFAAATGPPADGSSSLQLTRGSGIAGWYVSAPLGLSSANFSVEAWVNFSATDVTILHLGNAVNGATGRPAVTLTNIGTDLDFFITDTASGLIGVVDSSIADGATHHVVGTCTRSGGTTTLRLYVDGAQVGSASGSTTVATSSAAYLLVGGAKGYVKLGGAVNHAAIYSTVLSAERVAAHYHAGWDGFGGERSDQRIARLGSYAGLDTLVPALSTTDWILDSASYSVLGTTTILAGGDVNLEAGSSTVYGQAAGGSDLLTEMNNVADTEGGIVLIDRAGQLQFQARAHRYNRAPGAVVDSADIDPGLAPAFDDSELVNDVTAELQDGAKIRFRDTASIAQRGTYEQQLSLLTRDPLDGYSAASWLVARQAAPKVRYPSLTFDLATLPTATVNALLALDVGDRLDMTGLPAQGPSSTEGLFVEGYQLTIAPTRFQLTLNTTRADGWQVWVLDHPTLSILDGTTILAY